MGVIRRLGRWAIRFLLLGLVVWGLTVAAVLWLSAAMLEAHGEGRGIQVPVDAAIVLGGGIEADGVLTYASRRRVAAAMTALQAGKVRALILTGGANSRWTEASEAALMHDYALALGARENQLLTEERSPSTLANLRLSFALAESEGMERLALATDAFHLSRADALARYLGADDLALIAAPGLERASLPSRVWTVLREALAWWYNVGKIAVREVRGAGAGDGDPAVAG